jgi:pimeloyl-ACP methyl ester carboxylesterase
MSAFVYYKDYFWEYEEFGHGEELMFAFHGFDRDASDFRIFETTLGVTYKIISFNLFYHANSSQPVYPQLFNYADLKGLIGQILKEKNANEFSLLAYSLGGKIALACIELFPEKIKSAFLFAPDGIQIKGFYQFFSLTKTGNSFLKMVVMHPKIFIKLIQVMHQTGFLSEKLFNFVLYHLANKSRLQKVADIWMIFRKIVPDIKRIQDIVNNKKINIHLFFGRFDDIIPVKLGIYFAKGLNDKHALHVLEAGHNLLTKQTNIILSEILPIGR